MKRGRRGVVIVTALAVAAFATIGVAGCGGDDGRAGPMHVSDPAVGANDATTVAAYLDIDNAGAADALVGVTSPDAERVTLHVTDHDGDVATMRAVDEVDVDAGGTLRFEPGGSHLMVEGTAAPVTAGSRIRLHLEFRRAAPVDVTARAVPLAELPERLGR